MNGDELSREVFERRQLRCGTHERLLRDVHLAVCGDEKLGVPGLAKDVRELQGWRRRMDLRVAGIAGGVSVLAFLGKRLLDHF
jgi:hypothetical protein